MILALIIVGWLICGFIARCLALGRYTEKFPDQDHHDIEPWALFCGLSALIVELYRYPYRWRLQHLSKEQRWEIFQGMYPNLSREFFEKDER